MMPLSLSSLVPASLAGRLLPAAAAAFLAASAGTAAAQGPGYPVGVPGDPFTGGAYAVPVSGPVAVAQGFGGDMTYAAGPAAYPMTAQGGPVYMAPQVVGGPVAPGADCPCNRGAGAASAGAMYGPAVGGPVMGGPGMGGPVMGMPSYDAPMATGPVYSDPGMAGGMPLFTDPGMCSTGACPTGTCGTGLCDPAPRGTSICDPAPSPCDLCGQGLYHGIGGAQRHGWAFGYSWVFLKPTLGNGTALSTTTFTPGTSTTVGRTQDYDFQTGSRVFVEYVLPTDMGFRATYFGLDSDANGIDATTSGGAFVPVGGLSGGGPGTVAGANGGINLNTLDLDITNRSRAGGWLINTGGGLRLANFKNNFGGFVNTPGSSQTVDARYRFRGIGPTVFGELRRPIGQTNFALIASGRGSILYGDTDYDQAATFAGAGVLTPNQLASASGHDVVGIGEFQLGGEWSAWVSKRTVLFVSVAGEAQYWTGVGSVLESNADLGLFGFNTTVGLEF